MLAEPLNPQGMGGCVLRPVTGLPITEDGPQSASSEVLRKFDWESRWLNGAEYGHILLHAEEYLRASIMRRYAPKTHPLSTYADPQSELKRPSHRRVNVSC